MKKSIMVVLICGWSCLTGYGATNYVNRAAGSDAYSGTTPATAKRTIQAAVDIANTGDTVLVAPGIYDEGMAVTPGGWLSNRVVVTKDIMLVSSDGAAVTTIEGFKDPAGDDYGLGLNAVRCVYMTLGTLKGFTLTNGATGSVDSKDDNTRGGGFYAPQKTAPIVYDCIFIHNGAARGGAGYRGVFHRCRMSYNYAKNSCSATRETTLYDCLVYNNTGAHAPVGAAPIYNCTIVQNSGGKGLYYVRPAHNSIVLDNGDNTFDDKNELYNCCISTVPTIGNDNIITNSAFFVAPAVEDFRLLKHSPCLDTANASEYGSAPSPANRTDCLGLPRLQGSGLDIGALEGVTVGYSGGVHGEGGGTITPQGEWSIPSTLPTQVVFTATAGAGSALRHFTVNGSKMPDTGDTFTLTLNHPDDFLCVTAVFYPVRYVDAVVGNDAYDGTQPATAWRTLQYAVDTAPERSMVIAAPGFYDEGGQIGGVTHSNRVSITRNIVLKGSGAGRSFIMGIHSPGGDGRGTNAMRCVHMSAGELEGFTLTRGATGPILDGQNPDNRGGAIHVYPDNPAIQVWDCIMSNCVGRSGSAVWCGTSALSAVFRRCRFENNTQTVGTYGTVRGPKGRYVDCLFAYNNCSWTVYDGYAYNCTVVSNTYGIYGGVSAFNCISYLNDFDVQDSAITINCCMGGILREGEGNFVADPLFVNPADGDFRLRVGSPCVDRPGVALYGISSPYDTDLVGHPRVQNNIINLGAYETPIKVFTATATSGGTISPAEIIGWDNEVTFTALPWSGRAFRYFETNGIAIPYTGTTLTLNGAEFVNTALSLRAVFQDGFYADAVNGDDANSGLETNQAVRTLQIAVDRALLGDTVRVLPGEYTLGARVAAGDMIANRLVITNSITVCSLAGAEKTFIVGARSQDSGGCGPDAIRCAYLSGGATLKGFTLTGGATDLRDEFGGEGLGGGVLAEPFPASVLVECVVSNNIAHSRGGGCSSATLHRCRVIDNALLASNGTGAGIRGGNAYDTLIAGNTGGLASISEAHLYNVTAVNPTAVVNVWAQNSIVIRTTPGETFYPSIFIRSVSYCCHNGTLKAEDDDGNNLNADPLFMDAANGDYRLTAGSPCLDRANADYIDDLFGCDLDGAMRMQNGAPDMGAYEWDWRAVYANDLDAFGLTVMEATPFVTHVTNAFHTGGSAVYLDGATARANGQESVELALSWNMRTANTVYLSFEVDGTGALTLYEDEQPIANAVAADGAQRVKYTVVQKPTSLRAVYTAPDGDTGGALLDGFEVVGGFLFLLR